MKILSLCLALFCTLLVHGQSTLKWKYYAGLEVTKVYNKVQPYVKNMDVLPNSIWTAIDVSEFTEDKKNRPLRYLLPVNIKGGVSLQTDKRNVLSLGLNYSHFVRCDSFGMGLRFSDMIDEEQGFTMASVMSPQSVYLSYEVIGLNLHYLLSDGIGKYQHRLGIAISINRLMSSTYFINAFNYGTNVNEDYTNKDLTVKDKIWLLMPSANYEVLLSKTANRSWWVTTSFNFRIQEKFERGPLGNYLGVGVKREWH